MKRASTEQEWAIINSGKSIPLALRPIGNRILIREDEFKSRYDCKTCKGKGHTEEVCPQCLGQKIIISRLDRSEDNCPSCTVQGERTISYGRKICPDCGGKGGSIIIPDESKRPPTTGTIIAIGRDVTEYNVGDRVLYSNYTGSKFEMEGVTIRFCAEHDVYCEVKGLSETASEENPNTELAKFGIATEE